MSTTWRRFDGTAWIGPVAEVSQVEWCPASYFPPIKRWFHCLLPTGHKGPHRGGKDGKEFAWWGTGGDSVLTSEVSR